MAKYDNVTFKKEGISISNITLHDKSETTISLDDLKNGNKLDGIIDYINNYDTNFRINVRFNKLMKSVARISGDEDAKLLTLELSKRGLDESVIYHELLHIRNRIQDIEVPLAEFYSNSLVSTFVSDLSSMFAHRIINKELNSLGMTDNKVSWQEAIQNVQNDSVYSKTGRNSIEPIDVIVLCNLINVSRNLYKNYRAEIEKKCPNSFRIASNIMKNDSKYNDNIISERILNLESKIDFLRIELKKYNLNKDIEFKYDFRIYPLVPKSTILLPASSFLSIEASGEHNRIRMFTSRSMYSISFFENRAEVMKEINKNLEDLNLNDFFGKYEIEYTMY